MQPAERAARGKEVMRRIWGYRGKGRKGAVHCLRSRHHRRIVRALFHLQHLHARSLHSSNRQPPFDSLKTPLLTAIIVTNHLSSALYFALSLTPPDSGSQYRWPPKDPTKSTLTSHGWRADGTQAPGLFSPLPPGAASTSPFTYGSGFNPRLQPSNSNAVRRRGAALSAAQVQTEEEDGSSASSDSDHEVVYHPRQQWTEPSPDHLIAVTDDYDQYADELDGHHTDVSRVLVRRGSEGYEVRPRAAWIV